MIFSWHMFASRHAPPFERRARTLAPSTLGVIALVACALVSIDADARPGRRQLVLRREWLLERR